MNQTVTMRFAQKALIVREGKILFTKRSPKETSSGIPWDIPGGRLEFGEQLADALKREIAEEVALQLTDMELLRVFTWFPKPDFQLIVATYMAHAREGEIILSDECCDYAWWTPAEALQNPEVKMFHADIAQVAERLPVAKKV